MLSVIASESSKLGIFTGLALDDDIANADGSNLAVSSSFAIDYLDPEHLHKVVNSLIFPKHSRMQAVLSNVYAHFRETCAAISLDANRNSRRCIRCIPLLGIGAVH
jgi:hypothetical protein